MGFEIGYNTSARTYAEFLNKFLICTVLVKNK